MPKIRIDLPVLSEIRQEQSWGLKVIRVTLPAEVGICGEPDGQGKLRLAGEAATEAKK
jgi:hypothetical protein